MISFRSSVCFHLSTISILNSKAFVTAIGQQYRAGWIAQGYTQAATALALQCRKLRPGLRCGCILHRLRLEGNRAIDAGAGSQRDSEERERTHSLYSGPT